MYLIEPEEGGHLPWGITPDDVVVASKSSSNSSVEGDSSGGGNASTSSDLTFLADSISFIYAKMETLPINELNFTFSLDAHHLLHPFLDTAVVPGSQELRFKSVDDMLNEETLVDIKKEDIEGTIVSDLDHSLQPDSFFDDVQKHEVLESRFPHWNPGWCNMTPPNFSEDAAVAIAPLVDKKRLG